MKLARFMKRKMVCYTPTVESKFSFLICFLSRIEDRHGRIYIYIERYTSCITWSGRYLKAVTPDGHRSSLALVCTYMILPHFVQHCITWYNVVCELELSLNLNLIQLSYFQVYFVAGK